MKSDTDVPLEDYTDNVRKIVTEPLNQQYEGGAWETIKDPATPLEDLENALKILEEKDEKWMKTKRAQIKEEIKRRQSLQNCKEKARWWHPFRSQKEGKDFMRRWNEVTRILREEKNNG